MIIRFYAGKKDYESSVAEVHIPDMAVNHLANQIEESPEKPWTLRGNWKQCKDDLVRALRRAYARLH